MSSGVSLCHWKTSRDVGHLKVENWMSLRLNRNLMNTNWKADEVWTMCGHYRLLEQTSTISDILSSHCARPLSTSLQSIIAWNISANFVRIVQYFSARNPQTTSRGPNIEIWTLKIHLLITFFTRGWRARSIGSAFGSVLSLSLAK